MTNKTLFWSALSGSLLLEGLSLAGHIYLPINEAIFLAVGIVVLSLSIFDLRLGLMIVAAELIIGSKGRMFVLQMGDIDISLRMLFFVIVMSVWVGSKIHTALKTKKLNIRFFRSDYYKFYIWLAVFVIWGVLNGFFANNDIVAIALDANAWLFFLLLLPFYDSFLNKSDLQRLTWVALGALFWLAAKSLILLYLFSHNFMGMNALLYEWLRDTRVAEITKMTSGFYRIFMQSQIYLVFGAITASVLLYYKIWRQQHIKKTLAALAVILAALIVSLSRSYWLGLGLGGLSLCLILPMATKAGRAVFGKWLLTMAGISLVAIALTAAITAFPLPPPTSRVSAYDTLRDRATETDEAAIASRWQLLPELFKSINVNPVLGSGFGSEVTFETKDPRAIDQNQTSTYTTYAFEWGWLDIWLKLGLLGLLTYLALLIKAGRDLLRLKNKTGLALSAALISLLVIDFFSPYLNHPLGIGFIIFVTLALDIYKGNQEDAVDDKPAIEL